MAEQKVIVFGVDGHGRTHVSVLDAAKNVLTGVDLRKSRGEHYSGPMDLKHAATFSAESC